MMLKLVSPTNQSLQVTYMISFRHSELTHTHTVLFIHSLLKLLYSNHNAKFNSTTQFNNIKFTY